jgi:cutinase
MVGNVTEVLPEARGYPVQYPASRDPTSVSTGAQDVADRIISQSEACPDQTFSLVGYSQGAMVMRGALPLIPTELYSKIKSMVFFGDPYYNQAVPEGLEDTVLENCATGDQVCDRSGTSCPYGHISYTYPEWIEASEAFIVDKFTS